MNEIIELPCTTHLRLRRMTPDDLGILAGLHDDPQIMRHLGGTKTREETVEMHDRMLAYYDQNPGLGVWATIERESGACIGIHLLNHIRGESDIQVGYLLAEPFWGRGYATEMSTAVVRYGFTRLGLARIVGITSRDNLASQRVLLKTGLHRHGERRFDHPSYADAGAMPFFARDAADWLAEFGDERQAVAPADATDC